MSYFELDAHDFGPLTESNLRAEPGQVVLVTGAHGTGKSSVLAAIEWALRGRCRGAELKKDQPWLIVADAAKYAEVRVKIGELSVTRRLEAGGAESLGVGKTGTGGLKVAQQRLDHELSTLLNVDPSVLPYLFDGLRYLNLEEEARRAALVKLAGDTPAERIEQALASRGLADEDTRELAEVYANQGRAAAHAVAVERRRAIKREHAVADAGVKAPDPAYAEPGFALNLSQVDLAALRAEKVKLDGMVDRQALAGAQLAGRRAVILERQVTAEAAYAALPEPQPGAAEDLTALLNGCKANLVAAMDRRAEVDAVVRALAARAEAQRVPAPRLDPNHPPQCPLLDQQCVASPAALRAVLRKDRPEPPPGSNPPVTDREQEEAAYRAKLERDQVQALGAEQTRLQRLVNDLERARTELARAGLARDAARVEVEQLGPVIDPAVLAAARDIQARVERAVRVLAAKERFDLALDAARRAAGTRMDLARTLIHAERICEALEPDQIPAELTRAALAPLDGALAQTGALGLPRVQLRDDLSLEVILGGLRRHEASLSGSERQRLAWVVASALGALVGWPLVVCDEVALLLPDLRPCVVEWARRAAVERRGVAILAVSSRTPPRLPAELASVVWPLHLGAR